MIRYDVIVIGAGPAGLSASIEAAEAGMKVAVFDENTRPGGQLFKQIHKFFGAKEHKAKIRGFRIGEELLAEAEKLQVDVHLNAAVIGIHDFNSIAVVENEQVSFYKAGNLIIATGASENMVPFDGWTLPGVIGAGAAQTMMNLHGVLPGKKVLMVGSGNVGLVVGYQLLQAGVEIAAIIDAAPKIGGYGVHASKVARTGVPFLLSHTILKAEGEEFVTGAAVVEVDSKFQPIKGTEKHFDVDTICMAVGLSPMSQLLRIAGCEMKEMGGLVPACNEYGETSISGIFAAGDVAGIEEASSAMVGGRIAGAASALRDGFIMQGDFEEKYKALKESLNQLRQGMFCKENRGKTDMTATEEGIPLSNSLLEKGYLLEKEIIKFPGVKKKAGVHPIIECTQNIPCNPCQTACKFNCISIGENITALPVVIEDSKCTNCGMCVASCSGQAIFLLNEDSEDGFVSITLPYEFLPYPKKGVKGIALDRSGNRVCEAEIIGLRTAEAFDHTALLTMKVPSEFAMSARFFTL